MIITAVIITYGDRYPFLEEVINVLIQESIDKIVVVLNGVEINSKKKIEGLEKREPILHLLDLNKNTGSAGGFKNGIIKAIELNIMNVVCVLHGFSNYLQRFCIWFVAYY